MNGLLIIMAKHPALGAVKTRLSPPLTTDECRTLYAAFLRDTITLVDEACKLAGGVIPALAYTPPGVEWAFRAVVPDNFVLLPQLGVSLGERLGNLPFQAHQLGYAPVAMISSDSPTLPAAVVARCFSELRDGRNGTRTDVVLGPCDDGGYYLIGMNRPQPTLFEEIAWSTEHVARQTLRAAEEAGLRVSLLPRWPDVDTAEDLGALWAGLQINREAAPHTYDALSAMRLKITA